MENTSPKPAPANAGNKLCVELVFRGPLAHLVSAAACQQGQTPAEWCKEIIRANVRAYMEFEVTSDERDLETVDSADDPEAAQDGAARMAAAEATYELHHGREEAPASPKPSTLKAQASNADRFCVLLSKPTSDLVRWYCAITHHGKARTIDALVYETLGNAKSSYKGEGGDDFDCAIASVLEGPSTLEEVIAEGVSALPRIISREEAK